MNHLYIRHTVGGKLLLDSEKHQASFAIEAKDAIWHITIRTDDAQAVQQVVHHRDELNIFVVPKEDPNQRTWYYSADGDVHYDAASQQLIIKADAKFDYMI